LLLAQTATAQFPFRLGGIGVDYGKDLAADAQGNIILNEGWTNLASAANPYTVTNLKLGTACSATKGASTT
jgi:hypothetical protein